MCTICFHFTELPVVKVHCSPKEMIVEMIKPYDTTHLYLEHLKNYPGATIFSNDPSFFIDAKAHCYRKRTKSPIKCYLSHVSFAFLAPIS